MPLNETPYLTDIEDKFIALRGKGLMVSPRDWELIEIWKDRGIPLHIVLNSIEEVFRNRGDQARAVRSLSYCTEEVEAQYADWLKTQVGKNLDAAELKSQSQQPGALRMAIDAIDLTMMVHGLSFSAAVDRLRESASFAQSNLAGVPIVDVAVQYFRERRGLSYR